MTHKNEINRWSNCPDNTSVWCKYTRRWELEARPRWLKNAIYIVNDKYAEIRKQFIDDKSKVEIKLGEVELVGDKGTWWEKTRATSLEELDKEIKNGCKYRIKPDEPVYEWQWILKHPNNEFSMTTYFYTSEEEIKKERVDDYEDIIEKYEPSKRIRK